MKKNVSSSIIGLIGLCLFGFGFIFKNAFPDFAPMMRLAGILFLVIGFIGIFKGRKTTKKEEK